MSIILGLNCFHSDTAACIIKNGKLEFAIEEERLNRKKHTSDLPLLSIKECLNKTNTKENEITHIAFNSKPRSNLIKKLFKTNSKIKHKKLTKFQFNVRLTLFNILLIIRTFAL